MEPIDPAFECLSLLSLIVICKLISVVFHKAIVTAIDLKVIEKILIVRMAVWPGQVLDWAFCKE